MIVEGETGDDKKDLMMIDIAYQGRVSSWGVQKQQQ